MSRRRAFVRRIGAMLGVAIVLALLAAPSAAAADPVFKPITIDARFGKWVTFTEAAVLPDGVMRIEAVVREGTEGRTFLAPVQPGVNTGTGSVDLRYEYETPLGSTYPNTKLFVGFRVTLADGRVIDGPMASVFYEDDRFDWKTLTGSIVRVHWYKGDQAFGQRALDIGEGAVERAQQLLGVTETEPIDFYIYADRDAFYDVIGAGLQENVGGLALAPIRTLFANIGPSSVADPWVGIVVPHELTHIVFATATENPYHEPLHWLNEGLADYLAAGYDASARANVRDAVDSGDLMPLSAIVGQFPSPPDLFSLAYDEAVSAIDYLVRTYGQDALVKLIRSYSEGVSDDQAFSAALGVDTAGFEAGWLKDIGAGAPIPYGPKDAPGGPVPPDWAGGPAPSRGPITTTRPGSPGSPSDTGDVSGPVLWIGLVVFAFVIVAGILLAVRALSRGRSISG
ncbi:MAG TPA: peptidase MA family metallohydrolase [Candidatus Limnocylindrales bacterium]|nr:peptidase MA family metallohydrolase [Candidatus Limnocylindrales bacterium]